MTLRLLLAGGVALVLITGIVWWILLLVNLAVHMVVAIVTKPTRRARHYPRSAGRPVQAKRRLAHRHAR